MISIGKDQGVKVGEELRITRDGKSINRATVVRVYKDMCSAKVQVIRVPFIGGQKFRVKVNDKVTKSKKSKGIGFGPLRISR